MQFEGDAVGDAIKRLRRIEGQIAGVIRMIEEGRECRDVVQQIAAAGKALDRTAFKLFASQLQECLSDAGAAKRGGYSPEEMERLFMTLA